LCTVKAQKYCAQLQDDVLNCGAWWVAAWWVAACALDADALYRSGVQCGQKQSCHSGQCMFREVAGGNV
jgi:hypothetical protein